VQEWTDERLTWNPEEFGNLTNIIVKADRLWLPELAVMNGCVHNCLRCTIISQRITLSGNVIRIEIQHKLATHRSVTNEHSIFIHVGTKLSFSYLHLPVF